MGIVYSDQRKKHHEIDVDDVMKYGIEKACILANIHLFKDLINEHKYKGFPYMDSVEFYRHVNELLEKGLLKFSE